jgi:hypothetical protein
LFTSPPWGEVGLLRAIRSIDLSNPGEGPGSHDRP